jgi:hypothetical protein
MTEKEWCLCSDHDGALIIYRGEYPYHDYKYLDIRTVLDLVEVATVNGKSVKEILIESALKEG